MSLITALKSLFGLSSKTPSLSNGDRMLSCMDCEVDFVFDAGEQRFFKEKGFTDPKRCPRCRKKVRSRMKKRHRGGGGGTVGNNHSSQKRSHPFSRRNSVIDGDSPYADER